VARMEDFFAVSFLNREGLLIKSSRRLNHGDGFFKLKNTQVSAPSSEGATMICEFQS